MSAIIGPFPSTLVNGTVEDANQVQTLLDWIQSQVNSNATGGVGTSARNLIYNGAMQIAQRIGSGGIANVIQGTKVYTLDRWQVSVGVGSQAVVSQLTSTGLSQFQNALRLQRTSGISATTPILVAQSMETVDSYPLQGQTVNISFYARAGANYSPTSNALVATLYTGTGTDENVLNGYTGSVAAITQTFNITNNWLPYTISGTLSSTLTEFGLVFAMNPTGTAGTNDYFDLVAVQVELGPSASTFDVRPFSETIERCQRYYQKSFALATLPAQNVDFGKVWVFPNKDTSATSFFVLPIQVMPRAFANLTIYNPVAGNSQVRNTTTSSDYTNCSGSLWYTFAIITGTPPAGTVAGDVCTVQWSADMEL